MLSITLNTDSSIPLYEQIYQAIREYILNGTLSGGCRLPSTRGLAASLNVSRNTIDTAYYQLQAEGFIESVPQSGFYVCDIEPEEHLPLSQTLSSGINGRAYDNVAFPEQSQDNSLTQYDFSPFAVDISHFPASVWKRLSRQALEDESDIFLLGNPIGDDSLREAVCSYVHLSRQVECRPEQIVIGAGVDYLLQMLSLIFSRLRLTDITMENPCYMQAANIFRCNGLSPLPGILDEYGLSIDSIEKESHVVYVTPSHQYPLGIVMPFGRRKELLCWARRNNGFIIEDDHDSEFRYRGKPVPSLQSMDDGSHVIYIGTFSKSIAPAIRAGYMILPPRLLSAYLEICGHFSCTVSRLEQSILSRFLNEGYFEKHISRMRKIYKAKHDLTVNCLQPILKQYHLRLCGENAGLHLTILLPEQLREQEIIQQAKTSGIRLYGLHSYYLQEPDEYSNHRSRLRIRDGILLGYSNLTPESIELGIQCLQKSLADAEFIH